MHNSVDKLRSKTGPLNAPLQFCEIDEHGTNLPKELYDGHLFGPESYYDELAKVQGRIV